MTRPPVPAPRRGSPVSSHEPAGRGMFFKVKIQIYLTSLCLFCPSLFNSWSHCKESLDITDYLTGYILF